MSTSGPGGRDFKPEDIFGQFQEIFSDFFDQTGMRGADRSAEISIDFVTAAEGGKEPLKVSRRVRCPSCRQAVSSNIACPKCAGACLVEVTEQLDVIVPAGIDDGQILRLRGKGDESPAGAQPGSLMVTVHVRPHPALRRREADILVDLPIDRALARRGGEAEVPTLAGPRRVRIPRGAQSGAEVILRGHGAVRLGAEPAPIPDGPGDPYRSRDASESRGDQVVILRVIDDHLPDPSARSRSRRGERIWGITLGAVVAVAVVIALFSGC